MKAVQGRRHRKGTRRGYGNRGKELEKKNNQGKGRK